MKGAFRLLIWLLIVAVIFSFGYAALESVHDCHGEDCPICKIIAILTAFLGIVCLPFLCFITLRRTAERSPLEREGEGKVTPIALKVKLLN